MTNAIGQLLDSPVVTSAATLVAVGLGALWLAAAWWTYLDMSRRSDSEVVRLGAVAWVLLSTPALLVLSLPVYLLVRPQQTVAQERSQLLLEALAEVGEETPTCPGCGTVADEAWRRCPTCATWLQTACPDCGRWSGIELTVCPWCATEREGLGAEGVLIGVPLGRAASEALPQPESPRRESDRRRRRDAGQRRDREGERRREPARRLARLG